MSTSRRPATRCARITRVRATTARPGAYAPVPDAALPERRRRAFTDVTDAAGIARAYGAGLGVAVGDLNGDGWPDLYVANDATPNQLWINRHDGTFEDAACSRAPRSMRCGRPEGSMGIALGDADNDGDEDLFVTNIVGEILRAVSERRPRQLRGLPGSSPAWVRATSASRASAPAGSTTTTMAGSICSSPTAPSTSSRDSGGRRSPTASEASCFTTKVPAAS